MDIKDINERASNKAFSRILSLNAKIINTTDDLNKGLYGSVDKESLELILNKSELELEVWSYIAKLIETDNKWHQQTNQTPGI